MCSRSATKAIAAAALLGAMLGGCSDIYFDRRETVSLDAGDAMATNRVTQMIDPWPAASANRNIAFNGERMQAARRALPHRPRHPAGQRHHQLGRLRSRRSRQRRSRRRPPGASAPNAGGAGQAARPKQPT